MAACRAAVDGGPGRAYRDPRRASIDSQVALLRWSPGGRRARWGYRAGNQAAPADDAKARVCGIRRLTAWAWHSREPGRRPGRRRGQRCAAVDTEARNVRILAVAALTPKYLCHCSILDTL